MVKQPVPVVTCADVERWLRAIFARLSMKRLRRYWRHTALNAGTAKWIGFTWPY